jgi:hypothetical protein
MGATAQQTTTTSQQGASASSTTANDVQLARHAAKRLRFLGKQIDAETAALQKARETADPGQMRAAADHAQLLLVELREAAATVHKGVLQHPHDAKTLRDTADGVEGQAQPLRQLVARSRQQAEGLEGALDGPLSALSNEPVATDPDEVRRRADANAVPGLCDDKSMQGTSACPLDFDQRDANRDFVHQQIEAIGQHWKAAIDLGYTDKRFSILLEKDGGSTLAELLISMALGWVGGIAASYAFKGLSRLAASGAPAAASRLPFDVSDVARAAPKSPGAELFKNVGKKLGDIGGKKLAKSAVVADERKAGNHDRPLFDAFEAVATAWSTDVLGAVRQLPDAALVALGEGLKHSPFTQSYFAAKIEQLVSRFEQIDQGLGKVVEFGGRRMEIVTVVHPSGAKREALARKEIRWVTPSRSLSHQMEAGDDYDVETGRWTFLNWIDSSLLDVAHEIGTERHANSGMVFNTADLRWANLANPDLVAWHVNPAKLNDVVIFEEGKQP